MTFKPFTDAELEIIREGRLRGDKNEAIGKRIGRNAEAVRRAADRLNLPKRYERVTEETERLIAGMCANGVSDKTIMRLTGFSRDTITKIARRHKLPPRWIARQRQAAS